jgi:hypothetical protein
MAFDKVSLTNPLRKGTCTYCPPLGSTRRGLDPRLLSSLASYDAASNMWPTRGGGAGECAVARRRGRGVAQGMAVQLDPIKPKLKALGTKHSKLQYDELLSNVAFNFNVRRYIKACTISMDVHEVGRCRLTLSNPR